MTTVILDDGTKVPRHYDFNQHFDPLVVKNQGQQGICWWETRCTMLEAFVRMYDHKDVTFDPHQLAHHDEGWDVGHWQDERYDPARDIGTMTYVGGDAVTHLPEYKDLPSKQAIMKALFHNGILEGGTAAQQSMDRMWLHPEKYPKWSSAHQRFTSIPVLHTLPGDLRSVAKNEWAHAIIYVGYDIDKGILFQNSWGARFGRKGRAYNGWDMLDKEVVDAGYVHSWNDFPPGGLKMPPAR